MAGTQTCPQCGKELPDDAPLGTCPECLLKLGLANPSNPPTGAESQSAALFPPGYVPPRPEEISRLFPQLEVLELLGCGGMGIVYKVRQKHLDRLVALKILPPSIAKDAAFAERFQREAKALAKLNHPHIVTVYDFGQTFGAKDGWFYFLMEFVDGVSLRQMVHAGSLQPHEALAIVPQICEALQYAHDQGIVHRDIKPENLLVDRQGRVKIADFGLAMLVNAKSADFRLTGTHQALGTPLYMAPEQIERSTPVDHRADIYSLGVVFYEMLTGELPLGRFAPPSKKVQIDVRLDDVVLRTLEKEPDLRYQQVSQVRTEVETIARHPRMPRQRRWLTRDGKPLVRSKVVWWTLAACVVLAPVVLFVMVIAMKMNELAEAEEQRVRAMMIAEQLARQQADQAEVLPRDLNGVPAGAGMGGMAPGDDVGGMPTALPGMESAGGFAAPGMTAASGMRMGGWGSGMAFEPFAWKEGVPRASVALWQNLQLSAEQSESLHQFVHDAYRELRRAEDQGTSAQVNSAGKLEIRIASIDDRARLRIENQFWTKVDSLLDDKDAAARNQRRKLARELISLDRFITPQGGETIVMWRSGTFFNWFGNRMSSGSGPELPSRLEPLWRKYSHVLEGDAVPESLPLKEPPSRVESSSSRIPLVPIDPLGPADSRSPTPPPESNRVDPLTREGEAPADPKS